MLPDPDDDDQWGDVCPVCDGAGLDLVSHSLCRSVLCKHCTIERIRRRRLS